MSNASRDQNRVPTLLGVSSVDGVTPIAIKVNPVTNAVLIDLSTSTTTFSDNAFTIQDDLDNTKKFQFQASSISASTTRTYTMPDKNGTVAMIADITGDVSKVGTPVDSQIGVWTGDGTIEGAASLTYDGSNLLLTGDIGITGTRITKGWFTDLELTNMPTVGGSAITASQIAIATGGGSPTVDQVQEYLDNTGSSGFFLGGALSDGGSGTLDVAAGSGFIRTTNDNNAELQSFKWSASAGIAVADNTTQYVYVDDAGAISLSTDEFLETPDKIQIGVVTDEGGAIVNVFNLGVRLDESIGQAGRFIRRVHGITRDKRKGGLLFGQSGDANRDVSITAGTLWWGRTEYPFASFDTSGADTFQTYSANGQENAVASQFPNEQFDSSGTLTVMTNNRWANLFFYIIPNNGVVMVYGRAEFVSEGLADAEGVPTTSLPTKVSETGLLAARFTFQKSANTATISSAFEQLFANASVTDHGNLAGLADDDHTQYVRVSQVTSPQTIGLTGNRLTKLWAVDITVTNAIAASITGNSATATALETARDINGVSFNGTANITVTAAATTLTGTTLKSTVVTSSLTSVGTLTSLTMGGVINLGENGFAIDAVLSGDTTFSGITEAGILGATIAFGDLVYLNADDSRWELADANLADGYDKRLAFCVDGGNDGDATTLLTYGKIRAAALPAGTVGSRAFMSETAGDITLTAPTTASVAVRIIGEFTTAEDFFVDIDKTVVVLAA